jgi:hypothetical protein
MVAIRRYVFISLFFLCMILGLFVVMFPQIKSAFLTNVYLNGTILGLFLFGVGYNVYLFFTLRQEAVWFSFFEKARDHESSVPKPQALKPLQQLFQQNRPSSFMLQATFGSIQNRFDETRDINRYITGLLVFMGLLGTFWGLSHTVTAISGVISSIDLQAGDIQDAFKTLKEGLKAPLVGMGTAFSSSLFGLLGSLIIGFIDVQYGKGIQSLFYFIEERVHLGTLNTGAGVDGPSIGQTYSQSVFEQAAESMQLLAQQLQRGEENRQQYLRNFSELSEKLNLLVDQQNQQLTAIQNMAQGQFSIQQLLTRQSEAAADTTKYWRNLDAQFTRIHDEMNTGRLQLSRELCEEIRTVARILASLGEGRDAA